MLSTLSYTSVDFNIKIKFKIFFCVCRAHYRVYMLQFNKHPSEGAFDLQEALENLIKIQIPYIQDGIPDTGYLKSSQVVPMQMVQQLHLKCQDCGPTDCTE